MDASTAAPFEPDSPRRLKRTHTGISLKIPIACTPRVYPPVTCHEPPPFFSFRSRRFHDFVISSSLRRSRLRFRCRARLAEHTRRRGTAAPDRARARRTHGSTRAFGRRKREGLAECVKGRVCGGTRPSALEIRRELQACRGVAFSRVSGREARRRLRAYLDRGGSERTTDLARWRRASPTPRPLSGSRA